MFHPTSRLLAPICCGGILVALLGCSRSAVVVAPEGTTHAEETVARGKAEPPAETSFAFPDDAAGVLLAKELAPRESRASRLDRLDAPRLPSVSARSDSFVPPLPPSRAAMPRFSFSDKTTPSRPRFVSDEVQGVLPDGIDRPKAPPLPDAGRVRVSSPDVHEPIALPILGHPVPDRVSLDDPTMAASTAAAVAAPMPARTAKAPFLRLTLLDPYGGRRSDVPAPEESKDFPVGSPRTPRR